MFVDVGEVRSRRRATLPLVLLAVCSAALAAFGAGSEHSFGDWRLTHDGRGGVSVSRKGRPLVSRAYTGAWTADYAHGLLDGSRFTVTRDGDTVRFVNDTTNLTLKLAFAFTPQRMEVSLDADVRTPGAIVECGAGFDLACLAAEGAPAFMRVDGTYVPVHQGPFAPQVARRIVFEAPDGRYVLSNEGTSPLMLQDRRADGKGGVRYVFAGTAKEPRRLQMKMAWTVEDEVSGEAAQQRAIAYGTPLADVKPMDVANLDFEAGKDGWDVPPNATVDTTVFHGGRQSMKLTVKDVKRDAVYVTRLVPVVGGRSYQVDAWLKTKDVVETPGGTKSSAGAGLFIEWAGAKGEYIWGGEAWNGTRGTADWQSHVFKKLKAPDDACQMRIYLSLRDCGEAWFDDLKVAAVDKVVERVAPLPGAVLTNNCPHFVWKDMIGMRRYWVELSQDPSFPSNATLRAESLVRPELQWTKPLAPGVWYWRVAAPGIGGGAWPFRQVAQAERDCLAPEVVTRAFRLTNAFDAVTLRIRDERRELPRVSLDGRSGRFVRREAETGLCDFVFAAPDGGWTKGFSEPTVEAADAAGNVSRQALWLLNAPVPANAVRIGREGWYEEAGKRIFPIGIYEVNESEMASVRADGFEVVHTYRWEGSQDDAACRRYLDACWKTDGLRAFIGFDRGSWTKDGIVQGNYRHVARRVGALADHPGLFCWYLFDEPLELSQFVSPDRLTAFADLVRTLDPYHPVVVSTWWETMAEYRRSWDTHWTQAYGYPDGASQLIRDQTRYLQGTDSPITVLLNCNCMDIPWRNGRAVDTTKFSRDYDEFRAAAYLSFVLRGNGLFYWWYAIQQTHYYTAAQCPRAWADLTKVVREIAAFRPIVLAEGPVTTGRVEKGKGGVEWWSKTVDGIRHFIAVNTLSEPVDVEIDIPGEGRRKLSFKRYETKIFKGP